MKTKKEILEEKFNFVMGLNNIGMIKTDNGLVSNWSMDWITNFNDTLSYYRTNINDILTVDEVSEELNNKLDKLINMLRTQKKLKKIIKDEGVNISSNIQKLLLKKFTDNFKLNKNK